MILRDGDALPTWVYSITSGNLVNCDTISGSVTTTARNTSNVGTYAITRGTVGLSSNYALTYENGTATITAPPLAITATPGQSFVYGDTLTLAYTLNRAFHS